METVTIRQLTLGDGTPKICVPVIAHTYEELGRTLEQVLTGEFDMVEFRADFYFEEDRSALERIREAVGDKPILYTIRTQEEGGEIEISDDEYEERNLAAAAFTDLVDVQLSRLHTQATNVQLHSCLVDKLHQEGVKVLCSWHDFSHTPAREFMVDQMLRMQQEDCDITKIAVMPRSYRDVLELMAASVEMHEEKADRPFVTMSMGTIGKVTRVAGALTGSCITFGTAGTASAPGQIPSNLLRQTLQALSIGRK